MSIVDDLVANPGVIVAGQYTYKAEVSALKVSAGGALTEEQARMLGVMCHATTKDVVMTDSMLKGFYPQTRFKPERGWLLRGPRYTICVVANVFCFLDNQKGSPSHVLRLMRKALANVDMDLV